MNSVSFSIHPMLRRPRALRFLAFVVFLAVAASEQSRAAANLQLWDAPAGPEGGPDLPARADWKAVPRDLLMLEADPSKASSDPGYYGREYAFRGSAVVENRLLTAIFSAARGRVILFAKGDPAGSSSHAVPERKVLEFSPLSSGQPMRIQRCSIIRHAADEVALEVIFSAAGSEEIPVVFDFGKGEIVEVKPAATCKRVRLFCPISYGIVPGFIGDDLILSPAAMRHPESRVYPIPAENFFVGLLPGEETMLVMTWPTGKQQLGLSAARSAIDALDFSNDGQSFYLAALQAPGLWHREPLKPAFLERDVTIGWKRPFPARWITQLPEENVPTRFSFRESKGQIWRGVPGSYSYPVWFDGDAACYHLSKKVQPKGDSLIYFLEGQETPDTFSTPVDILKATLGRPVSDSILDVAGRKLRTHHRRGSEGVHRACTCGCTEVIQAIFEGGQEVARRDHVAGALGDMNYFVEQHVARIEEYRRFGNETTAWLRSRGAAAPELKEFCEALATIAQQIPQEFEVQKENMKSADYAAELTHQTMALTDRVDPNNVKRYMELLKAWRGMGGAQDYVVAKCHILTRQLSQTAGYGCLEQPQGVDLAKELRARCCRVLRNPDGYEIWADY